MKYIVALFIIGFSFTAKSQILNAESLRKVTDTSGFSGSASLAFSLKRDVNDYLSFGSNIHIQYKMNKHLVLLKNDIQFQNIEGNKFENSGITHLRYNYRFHPRIAWEIFAQAQYNKELENHPELIEELLKKGKEKRLTLLYGAKDETHNQAVVLKNFIENQ